MTTGKCLKSVQVLGVDRTDFRVVLGFIVCVGGKLRKG